MKKLLSVLSILSAGVLFAAVEKSYTGDPGKDYPDNYTDAKYSYANGVFTINSNYVWTDFTRRIDYSAESKTSKITTNDISEFGFYMLDNAGNKTGEYITLYDKSGTNNSVVLEKGQQIGIYMDIEKKAESKYVKDSNGEYIKDGTGYKKVTKEADKYQKDKNGSYTKDKNGKFVKASSNTPRDQRYSLKDLYSYEEGTPTNTRYTTTATGDTGVVTAQAKIDPDSWKKVTDKETNEQYYTSGEAEQYFCIFLEGMTPGTSAHYEYYFDGILSGETTAEIAEKLADEKYADASDNIIIGGEEVTFSEAIEKLEEDAQGGNDQNATGKPLPGVLTTILLGGAVVGAGKRFGKKRKNAAK